MNGGDKLCVFVRGRRASSDIKIDDVRCARYLKMLTITKQILEMILKKTETLSKEFSVLKLKKLLFLRLLSS
jgi:hypothetical protein